MSDALDEPVTVAFVCVQNAGRSQMATAFATQERDRRGLGDRIRILTGGTDPADHVHAVVVDAMDEVGFDLADRVPREVSRDEIADSDLVITMGCSADEVCPALWAGEERDWDLDDPDGTDLDGTRAIRDEIADRVRTLFDELFPDTVAESPASDGNRPASDETRGGR